MIMNDNDTREVERSVEEENDDVSVTDCVPAS